MLQAAFTSRSRTELHLEQVHDLSFSASSLLMCPQHEQVFDDGEKRPIFRMFLPHQSALYSNIETNVDQLTSDIACAKLWFFTILLTAKSSKQIVWFSRINLVDVLCKKSLRLFFEIFNDEDEIPSELIRLSIDSYKPKADFLICSSKLAEELKN